MGVVDKRHILYVDPSNPAGPPADAGPLTPGHLAEGDVLVVATVAKPITSPNLDFIKEALETRHGLKDLTVILLPDTAALAAAQQLLPLLATASGTGIALGAAQSHFTSVPANTSLYAAEFAGISPMYVGYFSDLDQVPGHYGVYLAPGATPTTNGAAPITAFAALFPQSRMNGGAGACTFVATDLTQFTQHVGPHYPANGNAFAKALIAAVTGACKQATPESDLVPTLAGPAQLIYGHAASYTLTVRNLSTTASTEGQLSLSLPAGMRLSSPAPAGCTFGAPQTMTCTPLQVSQGHDVTFQFQLIADAGATVGTMAVDITGVKDANTQPEVTTNNNHAQLALSAAAPTPVPALGWPALLGLSALLPLSLRRRQRKAALRA